MTNETRSMIECIMRSMRHSETVENIIDVGKLNGFEILHQRKVPSLCPVWEISLVKYQRWSEGMQRHRPTIFLLAAEIKSKENLAVFLYEHVTEDDPINPQMRLSGAYAYNHLCGIVDATYA